MKLAWCAVNAEELVINKKCEMNQLNPLTSFSTCTGRCFEKEACGFAGEKSIMPHLLLKEQLFTHRRTSEVLKAYYLYLK